MEMHLKVLLIEDSEADALLLERELQRGGFTLQCTRVEDAESLRHMLGTESWDIIITDYTLPHLDGLRAFKVFRETGLDVPFIIVSGSIGEDLAVNAMKAGIHDYVMKNNLTRLVPAIQRELNEAEGRRARRAAEDRLRETEKLRTVGELTASLIHDLKNPLQSILLSSELLNEGSLDAEKRAKFCGTIVRQVHRMLTMSEEVLDFVRGEVHLQLEPTHLDTLVKEIVETYEAAFAQSGIILSLATNGLEAGEIIANCDREKLWRALQNLINNAKDALPGSGRITLRVRAERHAAVIEVADNGRGIPEAIRTKLFEPFVTSGKQHGTGLGLAIVKNIVDAHAGSISFETAVGSGTTFVIKLPLGVPSAERQGAATAPLPETQRELVHG